MEERRGRNPTKRARAPSPSAEGHPNRKEPRSRSPVTMEYPQGCKAIYPDMSTEELLRRLKTLASAFQNLEQKENSYENYVPLCNHLAQEDFLNHADKNVRLLIACTIADILRVFAPDPPFHEQRQLKGIYKFLVRQLDGLKSPIDPSFKRYFYLLENLACVKSFNMCSVLGTMHDVICQLFEQIFKIVRDEHSAKVKSNMLDLLCPLILECDTVPTELLNMILLNILEPTKTTRKSSFALTKQIIIKCAEVLEPFIQSFFSRTLLNQSEDDLGIKVYDLIYELHLICPTILSGVWPQLEYKVRSTDVSDRLEFVALIGKIFSEKESTLPFEQNSVWLGFIGRFNDISPAVRIRCIRTVPAFMENHPNLRSEIISATKDHQNDPEESVRFEIVKALGSAAESDPSLAFGGDPFEILQIIGKRILDIKFKVRREALQWLGHIHKKNLTPSYLDPIKREEIGTIHNKIIRAYYTKSMEDKLTVERIFNTCLVPYKLNECERMTKLLAFFGMLDENASKCFIEIIKSVHSVRQSTTNLLDVIKASLLCGEAAEAAKLERHITVRIAQMTKFLPDAVKGSDSLCKLSLALKESPNLLATLESLMGDDSSCKTRAENMTSVLRTLGSPTMSNMYYTNIKILLERGASLLIDKKATKVLIELLLKIMEDKTDSVEEFGMDNAEAIDAGFKLIKILSIVFPKYFSDGDTLHGMVKLNEIASPDQQSSFLISLTNIARVVNIESYGRRIMKNVMEECEHLILTGTAKQGKESARCLFALLSEKDDERKAIFTELIQNLRPTLKPYNNMFRTSVSALGQIAFLMPLEFERLLKPIINNEIVKEVLVNPVRTEEDCFGEEGNWCEKVKLPESTQCMMASMKTLTLWLMSSSKGKAYAVNVFKLLATFIDFGGWFDTNSDVSAAEKSWLRLTAGCCMLKICTRQGVKDLFIASQFCSLSSLMNDEVLEVREKFADKLYKRLSRGIPNSCLNTDFLGFYALAGYEPNKEHKRTLEIHMLKSLALRREYINIYSNDAASPRVLNMLPDYMIAFAVPVLTFNQRFEDFTDRKQLMEIQDCLWFVLKPLILNNPTYSFDFYKRLLSDLKNHTNTTEPENEAINNKMYAICDIALGLIYERSKSFTTTVNMPKLGIPKVYFQRHADNDFKNGRIYLPPDMTFNSSEGKKGKQSFKPYSEPDDDSEESQDKGKKRRASTKSKGPAPKRKVKESTEPQPSTSKGVVASQPNSGTDDDSETDERQDEGKKSKAPLRKKVAERTETTKPKQTKGVVGKEKSPFEFNADHQTDSETEERQDEGKKRRASTQRKTTAHKRKDSTKPRQTKGKPGPNSWTDLDSETEERQDEGKKRKAPLRKKAPERKEKESAKPKQTKGVVGKGKPVSQPNSEPEIDWETDEDDNQGKKRKAKAPVAERKESTKPRQTKGNGKPASESTFDSDMNSEANSEESQSKKRKAPAKAPKGKATRK